MSGQSLGGKTKRVGLAFFFAKGGGGGGGGRYGLYRGSPNTTSADVFPFPLKFQVP